LAIIWNQKNASKSKYW